VNVAFRQYTDFQFIQDRAVGIPIGLIIEEVTSRPRHLLQRRITQNTPMGGILSNNFSKKEKKKYELFYLKNIDAS